MKTTRPLMLLLMITALGASCVSKKDFTALQSELEVAKGDLTTANAELKRQVQALDVCNEEKARLMSELESATSNKSLREEQIADLRAQIEDIKTQRDKQLSTVDDLTTLSQTATENIQKTLTQLEQKDRYIGLLQSAKTRADSINLVLAVNLKNVLADGINDNDIDIKVDKTVVMVNLSDKMLYRSGSASLNNDAKRVLGKIAQIVQSRPNLEVMVEGNTDDDPIRTACLNDNWDLSAQRATAVVRVLEKDYGIAPSRLIAAGRGEHNPIADNETREGKSANRRTRIIIMPKLDEFYDLLDPEKVPE